MTGTMDEVVKEGVSLEDIFMDVVSEDKDDASAKADTEDGEVANNE